MVRADSRLEARTLIPSMKVPPAAHPCSALATARVGSSTSSDGWISEAHQIRPTTFRPLEARASTTATLTLAVSLLAHLVLCPLLMVAASVQAVRSLLDPEGRSHRVVLDDPACHHPHHQANHPFRYTNHPLAAL